MGASFASSQIAFFSQNFYREEEFCDAKSTVLYDFLGKQQNRLSKNTSSFFVKKRYAMVFLSEIVIGASYFLYYIELIPEEFVYLKKIRCQNKVRPKSLGEKGRYYLFVTDSTFCILRLYLERLLRKNLHT